MAILYAWLQAGAIFILIFVFGVVFTKIAEREWIKILKPKNSDTVSVIRCKNCKWFNELGCAIHIVDESDKPTENDYCSFGERREENGNDI